MSEIDVTCFFSQLGGTHGTTKKKFVKIWFGVLRLRNGYSLLGVFSFYIEKLVFFFRFTINKNDTEGEGERGKGRSLT